MKKILVFLLLVILCDLPAPCRAKKPDPVELPSQASWSQATGLIQYNETFPDKAWWEEFQDPHLTTLITEALAANPDIRIARNRVMEAQALARQAFANQLPTLDLQGSFTRQRNSRNLLVPSQSQLQGAGPRIFAPGQTVNIYNVPLIANYELDVFLQNRLRTQAARTRAQSSEFTQQSAQVSVSAAVAEAYFQYLNAQEQIRLQQLLSHTAREELALFEARNAQGLNTAYDVLTVEQSLLNSEQVLPQLEKTRVLALHQLAVLTGRTPDSMASIPFSSLPSVPIPQRLAAGMPSSLMLRRPDVRAAEADMEASWIDVRVARREFFPDINLTGQFGFASTHLENLFNWQSRLYALGASLAQNLFSGGTRQANLKVFKARYQSALENYRRTLLLSFQEVEDSLAAYKMDRASLQETERQLESLKERIALLQSRYEQGLISYQEVLPEQRLFLAQEQRYHDYKRAVLSDTVNLYKALGGGW